MYQWAVSVRSTAFAYRDIRPYLWFASTSVHARWLSIGVCVHRRIELVFTQVRVSSDGAATVVPSLSVYVRKHV